MKVVINNCFGGFGLSYKAVMEYAKLKGFELYAYVDDYSTPFGKREYTEYFGENEKDRLCVHYRKKKLTDKNKDINKNYFSDKDIDRSDLDLIKVVKKLGNKANGCFAKLKIIEIPDGTDYEINEYDGSEHIAEKHNTWR